MKPEGKQFGKMTRYLVVGLAAVVLLACAAESQSAAPAKALTPLEQSAISAEKSFLAAEKKGDPAFLKRTFTSDFSLVSFDGQIYDRQDALDMLSDGGVDILAYNFKVVAVDTSTAIVTYDAVMQVPPEEDQGPPPRYQHFSSVWIKQAGTWKLKFQQTTPTHWGDW